jgi:hypothetical protein
MTVEDLYEAAKVYMTDEEAANSLRIDVEEFVRLCTISSIESPGQRKRRLQKGKTKTPSADFRSTGADRIQHSDKKGLEDVSGDLSAWGVEHWSDEEGDKDTSLQDDANL